MVYSGWKLKARKEAKDYRRRSKMHFSSQIKVKWMRGQGGGGLGWGGWFGLAWLGFVVDYSTFTLTASIFIYSRA